MPNFSNKNQNLQRNQSKLNPMEQVKKMASFSKSKPYQDKPWNQKLPTMTCPPELVEKFKNEAKQNHWKYTTLMTMILENWYEQKKESESE